MAPPLPDPVGQTLEIRNLSIATSRISVVEGRKCVRRGVRRPIDEWDVLIKEPALS